MTRARGFDVSAFQAPANWQAVKTAGYDFCILRVCNGYDGRNVFDANFKSHYDGATSIGLVRGAYMLVDVRNGTHSAQDQAAQFVDAVGGRDLDLPPFLDLETESGKMSSLDIITNYRAVHEAVAAAFGREPVCYSYYSYIVENVLPHMTDSNVAAFWRGLINWPADYSAGTNPQAGVGQYMAQLQAKGLWVKWLCWQVAGDAAKVTIPGFSAPAIDIDVFNGDRDALLEFAKTGVLPTPSQGGSISDPPPSGGFGRFIKGVLVYGTGALVGYGAVKYGPGVVKRLRRT
jgi:lysozyme